jgi:hypothetical protein
MTRVDGALTIAHACCSLAVGVSEHVGHAALELMRNIFAALCTEQA